MNEAISWIPGTIVLLVGVVAGLWTAFRLKRPQVSAKQGPRVHDLELEITDLEARRDELYARLQGEEELDDAETRELELAAARALRDLDRARAELGEVAPKAARAREKKAAREKREAPAAPVPTPAVQHPILWFATGVALTALVAVLIFWAMGDAKPDPMAAPGPAATASGGEEGHPEGLGQLGPAARSQAQEYLAELEANPGNFEARKKLMVLLAQNQEYFEAFRHAEEVLRINPDDPDALYISGVVRLTMGQEEEAIQAVDRVIAQFPEHVLAYLVRGSALLRLGRRDEGRVAWETALRISGGSSDIERMLAEEFGAGTSSAAPGAPAPAAPPPAVEDGSPKIYRVYMELTPGAQVGPGAMLFVSVHQLGGGPPAAVRGVKDPKFPLEVTLTQSDSNTGIPLPARGMIVARLDSDGHPGTESPDDLTAQGEGSSGELVKFVLW